MRKYAIEIYILSLVVLATAILVISDWERVTTLFAGKNDPDLKAVALTYFCGEGQVAGPGCAYSDASSFIDRSSNDGQREPLGLAETEALPEPDIERAPDVTLALSGVGEPVEASEGSVVAMVGAQPRYERPETATETATAQVERLPFSTTDTETTLRTASEPLNRDYEIPNRVDASGRVRWRVLDGGGFL